MLGKLQNAARYFRGYNISTLAAGASFFMLLSIVPLLTLVVSLLRYLPWTLQDLLTMMEQILPEAVMSTAEDFVRDLYTSNLLAVASVSVVFSLWAASRGVYGMLNGINAILGADESRSYIRRRLTAIFYTFLLIIALFVTLALHVFGQSLLNLADQWDIWILEAVARLVHQRNLLTLGLLSLLFTMIFAFLPAKPMRLRHVVPPAIATAIGWMTFSWLFSIYVDHGGGRSYFYGSMTAVVLGMLWLYICMCIVFWGGVLCRMSELGQLNLRTLREFLKNP